MNEGLLGREPDEDTRVRQGRAIPIPLANLLAAYQASAERRAALLPQRQGPSLTLPSPDVLPGEPEPYLLRSLRGAPQMVRPSVNQRLMDEAMLVLDFAGGMRSVRGAQGAHALDPSVRYSTGDAPVPPPAIGTPPNPATTSAAAAPAPAPPRATVDPEGRHLTAPRIFGRDANGQVLAHSPGDVGSLLDAPAGGVVTPEATMALLGLAVGPATRTSAPRPTVLRSGPIAASEGAAGSAPTSAAANARGVPGAAPILPRSAPGGAEAARRQGIGHDNPPPGPMPGEEVALRDRTPQEAPTTTAGSPAAAPLSTAPPVQAMPPEHPSGAMPEAPRLHDAAPAPPPAGTASPNEPVGARPEDDLTPPRLTGPYREEAERLGEEILRARSRQSGLPESQQLQPRPQDSVLDDPVPGLRLPGVEQRAAHDLRAELSPEQRLLAGGQLPANPFSVVAENAGAIADRILADMDPVVLRVLRGEWVGPLSDRQRELVMAAQFSNMRPLYDRLVTSLGFTPQEALDRTLQEARRLAATSLRSDTVTNLRSGALLGQQQVLLPPGASLTDAVRSATGPGSGFHIIYGQHPQLFEAMLRGDASLARAPKIGSFARSLSGDFSAVPVDVHNFRAQNMIFNDLYPGRLPREAFRTRAGYERYLAVHRPGANGSPPLGMDDQDLRQLMVTAPPVRHVDGQALRDTYLIYNDGTSEFARRAGITPTEAQGLMWVHYGGRTGLASPARTATQILDGRISVTAQDRGLPPLEVLSLYARNRIPLLGVAGTAGMGPLQGLLGPQEQARE